MTALYNTYKWYIVNLAQTISKNFLVPTEDLIQEGFFGLAKAYEKYNPARASFLAYSQYWIKTAMYSYAQATQHLLDVPADFFTINARYNKLKEKNPDKTLSEIASEIGTSKARLLRVISTMSSTKYYYSISDDGFSEEPPYPVSIPSKQVISPVKDSNKQLLKQICSKLTPEEFYVIDHVLALTVSAPKSLSWIGKVIGVTKERVRQIKNTAFAKITPLMEKYRNE